MAHDPRFDPPQEDAAQGLALALDAIEARLEGLDWGAGADAIAAALAGPVHAFSAAAKAALEPQP